MWEEKPAILSIWAGKISLSVLVTSSLGFLSQVQSIQYMEFSEVENQDDYYSVDAGYIHTQDQQGVYVMYDEALSDLKDLETELLLVASHYIEREKGQKSDF